MGHYSNLIYADKVEKYNNYLNGLRSDLKAKIDTLPKEDIEFINKMLRIKNMEFSKALDVLFK